MSPFDKELTTRALVWFALCAFLWRAFISMLTPIPSEDGVNYLWMAEQFAAMQPGRALDEVFPPLFSLAMAPFVALGLDPFRAGQLVGCLSGALGLVVIERFCRHVVPGYGRIVAWIVLFAPLPTRLAAEVYTAPFFHLIAALAVLRAYSRKWFEAGVWCGLAFWVRDEAAILAVGLAVWRVRHAWRLLPGAAVPVLALAMWRDVETGTFAITNKLEFNMERVGGAVFENLLAIPGLWLEAFIVIGVLAVWGVIRRPRESMPWALMIVLGIVLICAFVARRRFLVTWFFAVVPLAIVGLRAMTVGVRDLFLILMLISNVLLSLRIQDHDRHAERMVGEYLAARLEPGDVVVTDMTRVLYFTGARPNPPRHFRPEELIEAARDPRVRYVVLGSKRVTTPPVVEGLDDLFREHALPDENREILRQRGILVLQRR